MTICLSVAEVRRAPQLFEKAFRLAVVGVLILDDDGCRLHQSAAPGGWEASCSLAIVDDVAIALLRQTLGAPGYLDEAMVEAWTRIGADDVTLGDVVTIEVTIDGQRRTLRVREHPWGW